MLGSFDFRRVLFIQIAHFDDFRMTVQCIGVKIHFCVQRHDFAIGGGYQRIDFRQIGIGFDKSLV